MCNKTVSTYERDGFLSIIAWAFTTSLSCRKCCIVIHRPALNRSPRTLQTTISASLPLFPSSPDPFHLPKPRPPHMAATIFLMLLPAICLLRLRCTLTKWGYDDPWRPSQPSDRALQTPTIIARSNSTVNLELAGRLFSPFWASEWWSTGILVPSVQKCEISTWKDDGWRRMTSLLPSNVPGVALLEGCPRLEQPGSGWQTWSRTKQTSHNSRNSTLKVLY